MPDPADTGKAESAFSKANKFLKKWTGGDYYERNVDRAKKTFREKAPKTAAAVEKTADVLGRGAQFTEMPGGPMLGMARGKAPRAAADLVRKEGSMRAKWAEGPKPRAASDVKPGSARAAVAKGPQPKIKGSGTFSDRIGTAKKDSGARVAPEKYNPLGSIKTRELPKAAKMSSEAKKVAKAGAATAGIAGGYYGAKRWSEARKAAATENKPNRPMIGGSGVAGVGNSGGKGGETQLGANAKERRYFRGDDSASKAKPPIPKARPASIGPAKKSKTRIAFEKEFAKARRSGKKEFTFRGGKYKSYSTKLAK